MFLKLTEILINHPDREYDEVVESKFIFHVITQYSFNIGTLNRGSDNVTLGNVSYLERDLCYRKVMFHN